MNIDRDQLLELLKKALGILNDILMEKKSMPTQSQPEEPQSPIATASATYPEVLSFATPRDAWHATRVLCDRAGMSLVEKNTLCACIYQESNFYNYLPSGKPVVNENKRPNGTVSSRDWGICQINDFYHIGAGKDFESVDYVLGTPEVVVQYMIDCAQHGELKLWSSYSSSAYRQWLPLNSPMWKLATRLPTG